MRAVEEPFRGPAVRLPAPRHGARVEGARAQVEAHDDVPTPVLGSHRFASISAGTTHSCAVTSEGATYCWGAGDWGQVGPHTDRCSTLRGGPYPCAPEPRPAATGLTLVEVRVGTRHTCGRQADGVVVCWGESTFLGSVAE